jgi:hypothetical protein
MEARRKTSPNGWKTASDVACRFAIRLVSIDYSRSSFSFRMDCRSVDGIMTIKHFKNNNKYSAFLLYSISITRRMGNLNLKFLGLLVGNLRVFHFKPTVLLILLAN